MAADRASRARGERRGGEQRVARRHNGVLMEQREGQCFRLYTQEAFAKLAEFDAPEIQRCNLAAAVLQLVAMGQDPFAFEFIDHPGRDPSE
jgi:HrpA-like RNA helicase